MRLIGLPACPVCATNMAFGGVLSTTFRNGKQHEAFKYVCVRCRVEMTMAERNAPAAENSLALADSEAANRRVAAR